jgi:hypothetical protein
VNLTDRVRITLDQLKPRLIDLADGYAEFGEVDEALGVVKIWLVDGRLH